MPSLAIGITAFGAGELVFHSAKKEIISKPISMKEAIENAKKMNTQIKDISSKIEDQALVKNIKEIHECVNKIISTVEQKPQSYKKMNNFFGYYLPVTVNILNKYDEIENQQLNTNESEKFMGNAEKMIQKINEAFKKQLSNLYQSDMIDTDAEMKVFDTMLKSDGYDPENDFEIK